jgi:recombinational DNA repair ATPase RecF
VKVRSLQLEGFRNIKEAELEFGDKTLLVGQNGAGKTSLAEAVCVGLNGRSFRTSDTNTVLQKGAAYWRTTVRAERRDGVEHCIVITTSPLRRERMQIDEQNVRITQLNAQYPVAAVCETGSGLLNLRQQPGSRTPQTCVQAARTARDPGSRGRGGFHNACGRRPPAYGRFQTPGTYGEKNR